MFKKIAPLLLPAILLAGCKTTETNEEVILTKEERKVAMEHNRPPHQFGYAVYPAEGGIAIKATPRLHPKHVATCDFEVIDIPLLKATGSSSRTKMNVMLDTSSQVSWIEFNKAEEFNAFFLKLDDNFIPYRNTMVAGPVNAYAAAITQIRFDQLFMEDIAVFVRMAKNTLGPLARGIEKPQIDAILGYDMLKNFEFIRFDYQKQQVILSSTDPYTPNQDRLIGEADIIGDNYNVGLLVYGAVNGIQKVPMLLDFAGSYHFRLADAKLATTEQLSIGSIVAIDVPTITGAYPDKFPRVGNMILKKYLVTVCPRARKVYFELPAEK